MELLLIGDDIQNKINDRNIWRTKKKIHAKTPFVNRLIGAHRTCGNIQNISRKNGVNFQLFSSLYFAACVRLVIPTLLVDAFSIHVFFPHPIFQVLSSPCFSSSLPYFRNSDSWSHGGQSSPLPAMACSPSYLSREESIQQFLPSSTYVELCNTHARCIQAIFAQEKRPTRWVLNSRNPPYLGVFE